MRAPLARGRPHSPGILSITATRGVQRQLRSLRACIRGAVFPHDATALIRLGYRQFFRRIQIIRRRMHLWISSCNDEIHAEHFGSFFLARQRMVRLSERARRLLQRANYRPRFHSIYRHARPIRMRASRPARTAVPAGMTDTHHLPAATCPRFSAPIRRVNLARIHVHSSSSRLSNRQFHDSASGLNRLDWNPD